MKKFLILLKVSIQSMLLSSTHSRGRSRKKTATGLGAIVVIAGLGRVYRQAVTAFAARSAQSNYKLSAQSASSQKKALLRKEAQRFFGTPMYFWNAGLGLIMLLAAGSASLEMREKLLAFVGMDGFPLLPVTAAVICFCLCTCPIAAPSVSLEGK